MIAANRLKGLLKRLAKDPSCIEIDFIEDYVLHSYNQFYREYHNLDHIDRGLRLFDMFSGRCEDPDLFELAWWFHDIIYIPSSLTNEDASRDLAVHYCKLLGIDGLDKISFFIETTNVQKSRKIILTASLFECKLFRDIDFSILGSPWEQYCAYRQNVRKEWSFISDDRFKEGRRDFLETLLEQGKFIFETEEMRDMFAKNAIDNMKRELSEN